MAGPAIVDRVSGAAYFVTLAHLSLLAQSRKNAGSPRRCTPSSTCSRGVGVRAFSPPGGHQGGQGQAVGATGHGDREGLGGAELEAGHPGAERRVRHGTRPALRGAAEEGARLHRLARQASVSMEIDTEDEKFNSVLLWWHQVAGRARSQGTLRGAWQSPRVRSVIGVSHGVTYRGAWCIP